MKATDLNIKDVIRAEKDDVAGWNSLVSRVAKVEKPLETFGVPFEKGVVDDLTTIQSEEKNGYTHNPRLVEPLLGEISALIDRCIVYRKEGRELEIAAVAAASSKLIFDTMHEIDQKIVSLDPNYSSTSVLADKYPQVLNSFDDATQKGFKAEVGAQGEANKAYSSTSKDRLDLILNRLKFTQDLEGQFHSRHSVPGNAHNFAERFEQLRALFNSDIKAAYQRALAASAGLKAIFDFNDALPVISETGFIDNFLIWTRNAMRAVTSIAENEIEFSRTVPVPISAVSAATPVAPFSVDLEHNPSMPIQ